ncbi:OprD family porin [Pseudomonas alkylphenolica]|uniref:OprD family porin n=1 Tax=Pseudomonas alkylphenolica TaxID=237609 RepID=UPI0018D76AD8|nr:OprD family porin [Pseudomonas alkylphenolica]MBH3429076.1 OprD family porin [Pseudomonas alkylphenolica]
MKQGQPLPPRSTLVFLLPLLGLGGHAHAGGFIEDAEARLSLRNYFITRNYVNDARQGKAQAWTQAFMLDTSSGFTPGPVGFGLDVRGLFAVKLDGGRGTGGTSLLPIHDDGRQADNFGRLAVAAKAKVSSTELKVGEWVPQLPVLYADEYGRTLPQTFKGAQVTSTEVDGLTLMGGRFTQTSQRDDASMEDLPAFGATSDQFNFAAGEYAFNGGKSLVGLWHAQLKDIYSQEYIQFKHFQDVGDWELGARLGFYIGREDGSAKAGDLDNRTYSGLLSARLKTHTFYVGLQKLEGSSDWMTVDVTSSDGEYLANHSYSSKFDAAGQRSWQVRYDYNFAGLGVPGAFFMGRYISGDHVNAGDNSNGKEWVRELEVGYVIQSGPLKNLGVRWRNNTARRDWMDYNFDENRVIVTYPLSLL